MTDTATYVQALNTAVLTELDETYQLIYVAYDAKLTDKQVNWLVSGDMESLYESLDEWESDVRYESAVEHLTDLARSIAERMERNAEMPDDVLAEDVLAAYDGTLEWFDAVTAIQDRDTSDTIRDLARNTPGVLFRVRAADDDFDADYSFVSDDESMPKPSGLLAHVGLAETPENIVAAQSIIDNACTFGTVFWLFYADLDAFLDAPEGATVEVENPNLLVSNVYAGNGFEDQVQGTVHFPLADLRTDDGQVGYSWDDIAGVVKSAYRREVRVIAPES